MKINHIYKISDFPLIYLSTGASNWHLLENSSNIQAYLLAHPMWNFSWTSIFLYWKYKLLLDRKGIKLILLNNSHKENIFSKIFGFNSFFINQNIHACENNFKVLNNQDKKYDAVYIAAAKPYKRLYLAEQIKSLYIITYFWPDVRDNNGNWNLHNFEPRIKHANSNKQRINAEEINMILNQSSCGLALSKKEGAMWAIMEYLYSGLPIVTTKSIGGRDLFFDNRYVKIAKDNSTAIEKAVFEIKSMNIDPVFIRNETLKKVKEHRKIFYNLIFDLYKKHNCKIEKFDGFHEKLWGGDGVYKHLFIPKKIKGCVLRC
jgi:glycosyltransferase involved in cell wall biosynthesis